MDNLNDIVSEITKNQKFQNSVDDLLVEEKEKEDMISSITDGQKQQNNVDDLVNSNKEESSSNKEEPSYDEEEINYMNGPYYYNYLSYLRSLQGIINNCIMTLKQKYDYNNMMFRNPFHEKNEYLYSINNIGYPVPKRFIEQYGLIIKEVLESDTTFEDAFYEVEVIPLEYLTQKGKSVMKKIDTYQIHISLKRKDKIKKI